MVDSSRNNLVSQIDEEEIFHGNIQRKDENAIYVEYDPDIALTKLQHIQTLVETERFIYTSHLSELLYIIGIDITTHLSDILKKLAQDNDKIKRALLSQIPSIIAFLQTFEDGYDLIKDITIHPIFDMLANPTLDIKEEAGSRLAEAAKLLSEDDQRNIILTKILEMAHDDKYEENRIVSVQLLSKMAEIFGKDLCQQFVGFEFLSLGEDPQQRVQKEVVLNLPNISKTVSPTFYQEKLLSFYEKKIKANSWNIRKASVDVIVEMSNLSEPKVREDILSLILIQSLEDPNKWVRVSAYKQLGSFIATLHNLKRSERLFMHFMKMTDPSINQLGNDNEIIISCAYYFPGVLLTYGKGKWPELSQLLQKLIKSKNKKVKIPIACSLHEIAKIIGAEKAEKDLFEIYETILKDPSDSIKLGVIQNLSEFLKVFDKDRRENLLELVLNVQKEQKKWRIRQCIASQLDKLTEIYQDQETLFQYLFPITFKLCNDTVSLVREEAAKKVYALLNALWDHEVFGGCVIQNINAFALQARYNQRQTFVQMCQKLIKFPDLFKTHFLDNFVSLGDDKVTNVRLQIANVLAKIVIKKNTLSEEESIKNLIQKIQNDEDEDVRLTFENGINKLKNKQENQKKQTKKESISQHKMKLLMDKEELKKLQEQKKQKQEEEKNSQSVQKELIVIPNDMIENNQSQESINTNSSQENLIDTQQIQPVTDIQPSQEQNQKYEEQKSDNETSQQQQEQKSEDSTNQTQQEPESKQEEVKEEPKQEQSEEKIEEKQEEKIEEKGEEINEEVTQVVQKQEEYEEPKEDQDDQNKQEEVQEEEQKQEVEQNENQEENRDQSNEEEQNNQVQQVDDQEPIQIDQAQQQSLAEEQPQNQNDQESQEGQNPEIKPNSEENEQDQDQQQNIKPNNEQEAEEEKNENQEPPEEEKTEAEEQKTDNQN